MAADLDPRSITGLSASQAQQRLAEYGYNELPSTKKRRIAQIALEVFREPMFLLLVAGGALYFLLGDLQEAFMLLGFVFVVMGITLYQERKTERALEALRDLSSPRALVIRDSVQQRIAGREVVPGDILVLAEGDRVPADAALLSAISFSADESLLTGESVPVRKATWDGIAPKCQPGGDDLPFVYSGTLVVQGQGYAQALETGAATEIGRIGKALQSLETEKTMLQIETGRMVRKLAILGFSLCLVVIVAYWLTRGDLVHGILAGITLAMATLPEEFPVVLTIFLALGAWRIAQKKVLTRRVPAIETLGAATVLCVDKTGTLTQNRMTVRQLFSQGQYFTIDGRGEEEAEAGRLAPLMQLPETMHELVEYSILASQRDPFDPMEKALNKLGAFSLAKTEHLHEDWSLIREYPLSRDLLAMSHVWQSPDRQDCVIAVKGAPEAVIDLCHLAAEDRAAILESVRRMADDGLRLLGVAKSSFQPLNLPEAQHDFEFDFLGLVGLEDPIRPAVPAAIKECYAAGIRIIMITGDYPGTAQNIARQIGFARQSVITGAQLDAMDDAELQRRIKETDIFARVIPEQKLRLVQALKAGDEIVAMTGDGVNDAPALKAAHIGIAMGGRGTDVAREAAALVLLDDDFSSIVEAVRLGRRIFDNIKKAIAYILSIHVPIAGISLIPVLFKWPLALMPIHILFLELIIDPACSIAFEAEKGETDLMKRRPRHHQEPLFSRRTLILSLLQGLSVLLIILAIYGFYHGQGERTARAMMFTTLIVANLGLIMTNRSWSRTIVSTLRVKNTALWWVIGGALTFLALALYVPFLRSLFGFGFLHLPDLLIGLGAGAFSILWFEIAKVIVRRRNNNGAK